MLNSLCHQKRLNLGIDRSLARDILSFANSDRERECIRYVIFKSSGLTATQARRIYGFENMNTRAVKVEKALSKAQEIRRGIDELVDSREEAFFNHQHRQIYTH